MQIGIVVHSHSGHTAQFAQAIAEGLRAGGHEADLLPLLTTGQQRPGSRRFTICNAPDEEELATYDALLFGGPVWGFGSSPVITRYLRQIDSLKGKKTLPFVSRLLPPAFGATRLLKTLGRLLDARSATVLPGESLPYFFGFNRRHLQETVGRIVANVCSEGAFVNGAT